MTYKGSLRGVNPLFYNHFPLSFKGEGDTGGEIDMNILRRTLC